EGSDCEGLGGAGKLLEADGTFYGASGLIPGRVFEIQPDGSGFKVLRQLASEEGYGDMSGLVRCGRASLCGASSSGGPKQVGTVFSIHEDGKAFAIQHVFRGRDGNVPRDELLESEGVLYGATAGGGPGGGGVVFALRVRPTLWMGTATVPSL